MNYFKILRKLQKGDKNAFDVPVEKQQAFLETLGEAKSILDRGYKQYLCQIFFVPKWKVWVFNFAAAFLVPCILIFYLLKGIVLKEEEIVSAIIEQKGMPEVVPTIVKERYELDSRYWHESASLSFGDLSFIIKLIRHAPIHPYFVMKALMNVAYYSDMIRRHSPRSVIHFGEFSFSSSILTDYCHRHGVKHIDIMHGEKLYFIRDSYFQYDECYVWDEYYADLFRSLKAEASQFRVALPPSLNIDVSLHQNMSNYADYKYYLALYNEEQIKSIVQSMSFAKKQRKVVKFRPHPRYSDMDLLRKYVSPEEIELPQEVGIVESVSSLEYAVGSYTTVLSQAYFSGKGVILDDVTFQPQYLKLKELKYILAEKDCEVLSSMI